ncbi:DUF1697 domain-containing protein [Leptospira kirschneri]|uniref:DUF1697 domain-containing protein n=1 Tax=Leptospira kirschneri TaxID=29507 RepID=UPI00029847FE|nr:DUF1697 domain-containing protein [Leptospira kirschneri]EKQ84793.1 PF08002 family protein [Leptospira kirschneri serovar Grippotyphosa str. Moskva]EKR07957.1 PF08002 family protein [Leptospira kirschneri serovar Valbuzzi str. 200702274]EMO79461.1 PF08002 family protein [Leptospira kirschneri str. 200801774]OOV50121.1 hypothetical protein B1J94_02930 [Leptospira kirschneri serovar Grippotyphosa]UZW35617.1 DUF1697 domain-containing protein [Leptospira kirschneri]
MKTYIALLRGINVSGQKKILMKDLSSIFESLGFMNVKTYIQSGNVLFQDKSKNVKELIALIEKKIREVFGFEVIVFIRSKEELKAIIQSNPFSKKDSNRIYVSFLNESKKNLDLTEIETVKIKGEELVIQNKEIYFFSPKGYGVSKLSNNFLEKKLNVSATTRNWKTVITLSELTNNLDRG